MTELLQHGRESVRTLRVRTTSADASATRLRIESLLRTVDLRPRGLDPAGILCIHSLRDPLPGRLSTARREVRVPPEWRSATMVRIESLARSAARPFAGPVPSNAEAVWFRDMAELLACAFRDACDPEAARQWWWRTLLGDLPLRRAVERRMLESPQSIPAAFHLLATTPAFASFVMSLTRGDMEQVIALVVQAFALGNTWVKAFAATAGVAMPFESHPDPSPRQVAFPVPMPDSIVRLAPEAVDPSFSEPQRLFAAVLLVLHRAPGIARSRAFERQLEVWLEDSVAAVSPQSATSEVARTSTEHAAILPGSGSLRPPVVEPAAQLPMSVNQQHAVSEVDQPEAAASTATPTPHGETRPPVIAQSASDMDSPALIIGTMPIQTKLGGLLYLINYALFTGYYGDFTQPRNPGLALPVWDFVELLGRALLGGDIPDDPIWTLLAALSGRSEDEPPGAHFDPPEHESLADWLRDVEQHARERLTAALLADVPGVGATASGALAQILLFRPARIYCTETNVDAVFSLSDLPLSIRMAGLDRDPGWVPAAGRVISFHFE